MESLVKIIGSPDMASRRWVWEQYDHTVMADTVQIPGGDAAVVRVHGKQKGLAITTDVTPRYCQADPFEGAKQAVAEAYRNISAVGAVPLAVTDNLNFGNPQKPEIMGQIVGAIDGIGEACRALDFPVIGGNCSLYNETNGEGILPTPAIGGVGLMQDVNRMATVAFKREGDAIILIGETKGHLGQSIYLREIEGKEEGAAPPVDLAVEKRNGEFRARAYRTGPRGHRARSFRWRPAGGTRRNGIAARHRRSNRTRYNCLPIRRGSGPLSSRGSQIGCGSHSGGCKIRRRSGNFARAYRGR